MTNPLLVSFDLIWEPATWLERCGDWKH